VNQRIFISYTKEDAVDGLAVCRILENNQISAGLLRAMFRLLPSTAKP